MQVYAGLDLKVPSPSPSFSLEHLEPAQAKVRGSMASKAKKANLPTTTSTTTKNNSLPSGLAAVRFKTGSLDICLLPMMRLDRTEFMESMELAGLFHLAGAW